MGPLRARERVDIFLFIKFNGNEMFYDKVELVRKDTKNVKERGSEYYGIKPGPQTGLNGS